MTVDPTADRVRAVVEALGNIIAFDDEVGLHDELSGVGAVGVQTEAFTQTMAQARAALTALGPSTPAAASEIDEDQVRLDMTAALGRYRIEGTSESGSPPYVAPWCVIDVSKAEPEVNWPGELIGEFSDPRDADECRMKFVVKDALSSVRVAARAHERDSVLEEACKELCTLCRAGHPLSASRPEIHEYLGTYVLCKATRIRALKGARP